MATARHPMSAARVLDDKLANWSGGRRYTCPSYEIVRTSDGTRIAVPGFQPFAVYDVVTANLVPGVDRREPPDDVAEVLRWTGTPLASKEVAVVCDISAAGRARGARPRGRRGARRLRRLLDAHLRSASASPSSPTAASSWASER